MTRMHPMVKELLDEIEAYRLKHDLDPTNFGLKAVKDGHLIRRIKEGRTPTLKTMDRVRRFMHNGARA